MQSEFVDWNHLAGVAIIAYFYTPTLNTTAENRRRQKCKENNDFDHALSVCQIGSDRQNWPRLANRKRRAAAAANLPEIKVFNLPLICSSF